eukprot:5829013-Lingulodinium_polyedra.AAC.1
MKALEDAIIKHWPPRIMGVVSGARGSETLQLPDVRDQPSPLVAAPAVHASLEINSVYPGVAEQCLGPVEIPQMAPRWVLN